MTAGHIGSAEIEDLATRRAQLEFSFAAASLKRLYALAPSNESGAGARDGVEALRARFSFQPGAEGFPRLHLLIEGAVALVCQRCLKRMTWPVAIDVVLTILRDDREAAGLEDPFDVVLTAGNGIAPGEVVEDEILAALPLSPRHSADEACRPERQFGPDGERVADARVHRPMAVLAELLGRQARRDED